MRHLVVIVPLALTALLLILAGWGQATLVPLAGSASIHMPAIALAIAGVVVGAAWSAWAARWLQNWPIKPGEAAPAITGCSLFAVALLLAAAAGHGIAPVNAAVAFLLAAGGLIALQRCVEALTRGEAIGWRSYWGGLGGGGGGFTLLPATGLAFLSLSLIGGAVAVAIAPGAVNTSGARPGATPSPAPASTPGGTPTPEPSTTPSPSPAATPGTGATPGTPVSGSGPE